MGKVRKIALGFFHTTQREIRMTEGTVFPQNPETAFQRGFERIARTRMAGLPLLNPNLSVRALGFERTGPLWLGALVTPWSIFAVLAVADEEALEDLCARPGETVTVTLPAGDFSFLGADEPEIGRYLTLSLVSPVFEIPRQDAAQGIALEALRLLREGLPEIPEETGTPLKRVIPIEDAREAAAKAAQPQSRRAFLTRYFR